MRTETFLFGMMFVGVLYLLWQSRSVFGPVALGLFVALMMSPEWSGSVRHALRRNGSYIFVIGLLVFVAVVNVIRKYPSLFIHRFISEDDLEKLDKLSSVATGFFFVVFFVLVIVLAGHVDCSSDPEDCRPEPW